MDVLDYLARTHPKRAQVIDILQRTATALGAVAGARVPSRAKRIISEALALSSPFVIVEPSGKLNLHNVCEVAGLGGKPYRDGSCAYYTSTENLANDPKCVAMFVMASLERE